MDYSHYPFYISFDEVPVSIFCTTRHGGFSLWPFETCNISFNTQDSPEIIIENRIITAARMKIPVERFVFLNQVHGDSVHYVGASDCGKAFQVPVLEGDAMFTDQMGVCLAISLADCVGVIIFDPEKYVSGICHSGWKGCLMNICGKLVDKMVENCGCKPDNLIACISPSICYRCYTVSAQLAEKFGDVYRDFVIENNKSYHLDLKGIVVSQLTEKGINRNRIFSTDMCTAENTHIFYSHRVEKNTGRFMFGIYMQ